MLVSFTLSFALAPLAHPQDVPAVPSANPPAEASPAPAPAAPAAVAEPGAPAEAAIVVEKSPWSLLGVVGGGLIGLGMGVTAVSTVVLLTEEPTTIKLYRYIELGVGSAEIITGVTLVIIDGRGE